MVAGNLIFYGLRHVLQAAGSGILHNFGNFQQGGLLRLPRKPGNFPLLQDSLVPADRHHIGVGVHDAHKGAVLPGVHGDLNVKNPVRIRKAHGNGALFQEFLRQRPRVFRRAGQHLQLQIRVSGHHTGGNGRFDALHPPGLGHNHTFNVFDNAAADRRRDSLRLGTQGPVGHGRAVGQGDGLGAPGGRNQLVLQDLGVIGVLPHGCSSRLYKFSIRRYSQISETAVQVYHGPTKEESLFVSRSDPRPT